LKFIALLNNPVKGIGNITGIQKVIWWSGVVLRASSTVRNRSLLIMGPAVWWFRCRSPNTHIYRYTSLHDGDTF
jgi:hypothetical protein